MSQRTYAILFLGSDVLPFQGGLAGGCPWAFMWHKGKERELAMSVYEFIKSETLNFSTM